MSETEVGPGKPRPRVLVGVDGSPDGIRALLYAMREAQVSAADLWIVHVVDDKATVGGLWDLVSTPQARLQGGEERIQQALAVLAGEGFPRDRVISEVLVGRPGVILAGLSGRAQLMVVGRRSISGLERMFVGSTSVSVATRADCPVIVISAASTPHETGGLRVVAVAISTWPPHRSSLEWGAREAALRKAVLRVVHVVPETLGVEGVSFVAAATADLEKHLAPIREAHPEVTWEVEVRLGAPSDELIAESRTVDLLILGIHPEGLALGGSVRGVMAHAHCPVGLTR